MCFGGTISVLVATKTDLGKTNAVFVLSEREMKKSNTILKIFLRFFVLFRPNFLSLQVQIIFYAIIISICL